MRSSSTSSLLTLPPIISGTCREPRAGPTWRIPTKTSPSWAASCCSRCKARDAIRRMDKCPAYEIREGSLLDQEFVEGTPVLPPKVSLGGEADGPLSVRVLKYRRRQMPGGVDCHQVLVRNLKQRDPSLISLPRPDSLLDINPGNALKRLRAAPASSFRSRFCDGLQPVLHDRPQPPA